MERRKLMSQFLIGMVLHNVEETLMKVVFKSQFLIGMVLQKKHMELKSRQLVSIPHRYGTPFCKKAPFWMLL